MVGKILLFNKKTKPAFAESANIPEWKALPCSALAAAGLHVQGFVETGVHASCLGWDPWKLLNVCKQSPWKRGRRSATWVSGAGGR